MNVSQKLLSALGYCMHFCMYSIFSTLRNCPCNGFTAVACFCFIAVLLGALFPMHVSEQIGETVPCLVLPCLVRLPLLTVREIGELRAGGGFRRNFSNSSSSWVAFERHKEYFSLSAKLSNSAFLKCLFSAATVQYISGPGSVPTPI